jgi:DNA-binding XRE family transcriptional regulator
MEIDKTISEMVLLTRRNTKINGKKVRQHELALMCGVSVAHINALETGRHTCSIKLLNKIAEVLGKKLTIKFEDK